MVIFVFGGFHKFWVVQVNRDLMGWGDWFLMLIREIGMSLGLFGEVLR